MWPCFSPIARLRPSSGSTPGPPRPTPNPPPSAFPPRCPDCAAQGIKQESLVQALTKVRGFFLRYTEDPANATVKTWNVKTLSVARDARYGDKCALGLAYLS